MKRMAWTRLTVIVISLIVALVLGVISLPVWLNLLWPAWILLVLIYWALVLPETVGVGVAWLVGLLMDVLNGSVLGAHALALVVAIYFVAKFKQRIRLFGVGQQCLVVLISVLIYQSILLWAQGLTGYAPINLLYWLPTLTSAIMWPLVVVILRYYIWRYKISVST